MKPTVKRPGGTPSVVLAFAFALLASACGSGGATGYDDPPPAAKASLAGRLVTRDGTTGDLAGVGLRLANTGELALTRADGSFQFADVPTGTVTVRLEGARTGATANRDDDGDDDDTGDDDFDIEDLEAGEQVRVRVRVEGGVIVALEVRRSRHAVLKMDIELQRALEAGDPDVEGHALLTSREDRQVFQVELEDLRPGREVELFVIDPDGVEESQGVRTVSAGRGDDEDDDDQGEDGEGHGIERRGDDGWHDDDVAGADDERHDDDDDCEGRDDDDDCNAGEAEWRLDTRQGDTLPFGVGSVADLQGFKIEIRDANDGTLLLFSDIPALPDLTAGDDPEEAVAALVAEVGVAGRAFVEIERGPEDGDIEQEFEVEVERLALAAGTTLEVFLADAGGTLTSVGTFAVDAEGDGKLLLETDGGGMLPFGAATIEELVGRPVEVRLASDGSLLFSGAVPPLL